MTRLYEQFLGSEPGTVVELVDDSQSPYRVRASDGFEFDISAEDFKSYYREKGSKTPAKWRPFVTDPDAGTVESASVGKVVRIVRSAEQDTEDYTKARAFIRDLARVVGDEKDPKLTDVRARMEENGHAASLVTEELVDRICKASHKVRELLRSDSAAEIPFLDAYIGNNGEPVIVAEPGSDAAESPKKKPTKKKAKKTASTTKNMKNVELKTDGDILTITVDLSKDFGPSKSGKTIIVASTQGNKKVPGREERIGLNIYRQESKRTAKGRRNEFKNVVMSVDGDSLTITVDMSKEFGPSKSGQTTIIASSEGNQLVYDREEKIGLNVYRKND